LYQLFRFRGKDRIHSSVTVAPPAAPSGLDRQEMREFRNKDRGQSILIDFVEGPSGVVRKHRELGPADRISMYVGTR